MRKSQRLFPVAGAVAAAVISFTLISCSAVSLPVQETPSATPSPTPTATEEAGDEDASIEVVSELTPTPETTPEPTPEPTPVPEEKKDVYDSTLADKHVRLRLVDSGKDVFALWGSGKPDYRYGPSMILNNDGSIDAWFASPGDGKKEYDWMLYRRSEDGGETWSDEKIVLAPTPCSADHKSVCDPDVFCYDGYYYMGYTGTVNEDGLCNNVFLARSKNPDGPYEKWNGKGWGGDPVPIIYFTGVDIGWGVGEPSFVIVGDTIYVYNTLDSFSNEYGWVRATQVRTADITDPLWPQKLHYEGIAMYRNDATDRSGYTYADSDSWNVVYLEESRKFVALTTNRRFKKNSCLLYYESNDGINFERVSELNTNVISGCHNCGIMSDASGHIKKNDKKIVGYAYAGSGKQVWGVWATRFAPITIDYTDNIDREDDKKENLQQEIKIDESLLGNNTIMLTADPLVYTALVGGDPVNIRCILRNSFRKKSSISLKAVTIENYDHNILELNEDNQLIPIHEGRSVVTIGYEGLQREVIVCVLPQECDETRIRRFYPVCPRMDLKVKEPIILQLRPMAVFADYDVHELSAYERNKHNVKFKSSKPSVCSVKNDGTLKPHSVGSCVITVEADDCRYTVDVYVSE